MAKAIVTIPSGFRYKGKQVLKGEELTVSKLQLERWERLGYAKEAGSTTKVASKPAKKTAAKTSVKTAAKVSTAPAKVESVSVNKTTGEEVK